MVLTITLAALALLSLALTLWHFVVARRFPLHQRAADKSHAPAVALLKPLKGCDAETSECLQSWLQQDYSGPVQVLFGVASADDPVCEVVRQLIAAHPQCDARLVLCSESPGPNAKVSTLIQLERLVGHDVVIISDADVRVPPDLLSNLVTPLREPKVGLVNCFYRLANPGTLAMRWEALCVNADFWSQVLQARSLKPLNFALGAVMAVKRQALQQVGGFTALADYLADDYQLGHLIAARGWGIELCPVVVECWEPPMTWRRVWGHQLRWARTIRVCQPWPYFFSILSNATLWPMLWLLQQGPSASFDWRSWAFSACLLARVFTATRLQSQLTLTHAHSGYFWLVPVKDLLGAVLWVLALIGNTVEWRGLRYRVLPGGKLVKI